MSALQGARVALLEARFASELAELVRRDGGIAGGTPAVREAPVDVGPRIPALVDALGERRLDVVVCLTGAGVSSLLAQADALGRLSELLSALAGTRVICRGPKPAAVLRRHAVPIFASAASPHTTEQLLAVLPDTLLRGHGVLLLPDGGSGGALADMLRARGAVVEMVDTYRWELPEDVGSLERLVESIIAGAFDAVAFTTQIQARNLFGVAERMGRAGELREALRFRTIVGSIGPTCSRVLEELGVQPHVVASPPKMRPLVTALGVRYATQHLTPQEAAG